MLRDVDGLPCGDVRLMPHHGLKFACKQGLCIHSGESVVDVMANQTRGKRRVFVIFPVFKMDANTLQSRMRL